MANPKPAIPTPCDECSDLSTRRVHGLCPKCYHTKWYREHPEAVKKRATDWAKKNPEKRAAIVRNRVEKDRATHPEKYREKERKRWAFMSEEEKERRRAHQRERYATDPRRREDLRASRKRNPLTKQTLEERRRARKRGVIRTLTVSEWKLIRDVFGGKCVYCGLTGRMTQDHIIPLSKGGGHCLNNVVPACQSCNSKKHDGLPLRPVQPLLL